MYKETVATISQLSFSALATALSIQQSVIENNPALRVDPHQASARVTGSNDQNETPRDDEKDEKDANSTSAKLGTININVMTTPRSGVSVDDDEVDGVGDEIGDVDDNEVDGVGDKVGGVNTSVQCVDLMLEVIPGLQWTTAFGSIYIRTANLLWAPSDVR
ncbi:hypothetical protein NDA17_002254 [Ustilago hordei]|nr:hypothetical protein NDA17_002254 [Ustilago hordei]